MKATSFLLDVQALATFASGLDMEADLHQRIERILEEARKRLASQKKHAERVAEREAEER